MHRSPKQCGVALAGLMLLFGCQAPQTAPAPAGQTPELLGSTRVGGKGIPNGRSDSTAPYLKGVRLAAASDPEYGRTPQKPIFTGPLGGRTHILFLNSLRGMNGEPLEYERRGSCCEFEDKSLPWGGGLLDVYTLRIDGGNKELTLYVNMYRPGPPQIPPGFAQRQ
jgi:hypothetical protein